MLVLTSTSNPQKQAALAIKHGILMVGSREIMVEETINRLESEYTLQSNQKFATINQMAGQGVDASLFINFSKLPVLLTSWLNDNFQANANFVADVGDWGEVDLRLTKSRLTTSGIITTSDSATSFLGLIADQKPFSPKFRVFCPHKPASTSGWAFQTLVGILRITAPTLTDQEAVCIYAGTCQNWW